MRITSHLSGLKVISHSCSQVSFGQISLKGLAVTLLEMAKYVIASSANSLILLWVDSGISLIYIKTPDRTGHESDCSPCRTTLWVLEDPSNGLLVYA